MRYSKLARLLAVLFAFTLVAAACGDDGDTDTETGSEQDGGTDGDGGETDDSDGDGDGDGEADGESSVTDFDALCEAAKDDGVEAPDGYVARLVTDLGTVTDRTFNQAAFEGMEAAADCFGFDTSFIETATEADYAANIATVLEGGPDLVITTGALLGTDTLAAAEENADTHFLGIDQFQVEYPDNYTGILYREDQGGFIAGVAAAQLTESNVIGVVGGREDVPPVVRLVNSFETGAKSVNPDIQVLKVFNESFTDTAKGASDAQQFLGEGADVIFGAGGLTGSAGIVEAASQGAFAIGVDKDEYFSTFEAGDAPGADLVATSALKKVDLAVFEQIVADLSGELEGGAVTYTAADGGIGFAPPHDADVPDDFVATLEETVAGLADGSIDTGVDPITGLPS